MLVPCGECGRHVRALDATCPFCDAPRSRLAGKAKRAAAMVASIAVGATLAACYGRPVSHDNLDRQPLDASGDAATSASAKPSANATASASAPAASASVAPAAPPSASAKKK